jgi:hypothetical protein
LGAIRPHQSVDVVHRRCVHAVLQAKDSARSGCQGQRHLTIPPAASPCVAAGLRACTRRSDVQKFRFVQF